MELDRLAAPECESSAGSVTCSYCRPRSRGPSLLRGRPIQLVTVAAIAHHLRPLGLEGGFILYRGGCGCGIRSKLGEDRIKVRLFLPDCRQSRRITAGLGIVRE